MSTNENDLTFVTIEGTPSGIITENQTALYKRNQGIGPWILVTVENGDQHSSLDTIRSLGQAYRTTTLITHLRKGGMWMQVVNDHLMQHTTPTQKIETEIFDLRAEADSLEESARYSDDRHSGYGTLRIKADAMQYVLDTLTDADND